MSCPDKKNETWHQHCDCIQELIATIPFHKNNSNRKENDTAAKSTAMTDFLDFLPSDSNLNLEISSFTFRISHLSAAAR
jgi:hypothetical protein